MTESSVRPQPGVVGGSPISRRLVSLAGWNVSVLISGSVYTVVSSALIYRVSGREAFGIWATILAIRGLVVFVEGGLSLSMTRDAALASSDRDAEMRLHAARIVFGAFGALVLLIGVFVSLNLGRISGLPDSHLAVVRSVGLLIAVDTALLMLSSPFAAELRGKERYSTVAVISWAQALVSIALLVPLLSGVGLVGAACAALVGRAVSTSLFLAIAARAGSRRASLSPTKSALHQVIKFASPVWIIAIASQISVNTDVPIVARFFGPGVAGHYALGSAAPKLLASLVFVALDSAFPRFSRMTREDVSRLTVRLIWSGGLIAGFIFGSLVLNADLILTLWVGAVPRLAVLVLSLYSFTWMLNVPSHILVLGAIGQAKHGLLAPLLIAEAIVNLGASVLLASHGFDIGPALATVIVVSVTNGVLIPVVLIRRGGLPRRSVYAKGIGSLGTGLLVATLGWLPAHLAHAAGPLAAFILAASGLLAAAGIGTLVVLPTLKTQGSRGIGVIVRAFFSSRQKPSL